MSTLSLRGALWHLRDVDDQALSTARAHGLSEAAARCMALRNLQDEAAWLAPSLDHLHDPMAMANMGAAIERLERAVTEGQRLRVITDYDVDGTTSSLILQAALRLRGPTLQIDHHIPDRFTEGYGFSVASAQKAAADGIDLIITADIGVRDHASVTAAREGGVDVLICDHHLPDGASVPPNALVLCPPQIDCHYPNPHLAACGVSLKVAQALLAQHPKRDLILRSMLKLAAIGTVADMVPLTTLENRAIVSLGLDALNQDRHTPGLSALLDVAGLEQGSIGVEDIAFRIGPRINAAGRITKATHVVDLLTCRDPGRAAELAAELDALNQQRRQLQQDLVETALAQVTDPPDDFVLVAGPETDGWHKGVVGIVAARLKEVTNRPVAVVAIRGDRATASVRSVSSVHAVRALESASDLLVKFGGHPAAAGFTIATDNLEALRERLCAYVASTRSDEDLTPVVEIDTELDAAALELSLHAELAHLGPFGQGNPEPLVLLRDLELVDVREMGRQGNHVHGKIKRAGRWLRFLWWRGGEHAELLRTQRVDLVGKLQVDHWQGNKRLQLLVEDARASA